MLTEESERRHSRLGIASFVTALSVGVFVLIFLPALMAASMVVGGHPDSTGTMVVGFGLMIVMLLTAFGLMTGLGLGIAGVCQRSRQRVFAVIGLCLNAIGLIFCILLVAAGFILGSAAEPPGKDSDGWQPPDTERRANEKGDEIIDKPE